jgi:glycosyltransferase involved in cell wall biosynthesis
MGHGALNVGVDVLTIQSPGSGRDEVRRHVLDVLKALLARAEQDGATYFLYTHETLPDALLAESHRSRLVTAWYQPGLCPSAAIEGLLGQNPDGLDAFLVLDPFDPRPGQGPPPRFPAGPRTIAYLPDASWCVLQDCELPDLAVGDRLYRHLERLRSYDFLVTANAAMRDEFQRLLDLPAGRILAAAGEGNWRERAARVIFEALIHAPARRRRRRTIPRRSTARRIALFSPFPPRPSGVADHAEKLARALRPEFAVDLFHEAGYVPETALASPDFGCFDERLYPRIAAQAGYHGALYQMGNSHYHTFVYERSLKTPGIVTLHDFCLSCYHASVGLKLGTPVNHLRSVVEDCEPGRADELIAQFPYWATSPGGIPFGLARAGAGLSRRVVEAASAVVVHSRWCRDQVERHYPEFVSKVTVIPLGTDADRPTPPMRAETRARFGLPADALIFGAFGALGSEKMTLEFIAAFAEIRREFSDALLIFVGEDTTGGEPGREVARLEMSDRVRLLGRTSAAHYHALAAAVDLGVSLRRPPTHGESSASLLDLLCRGIPTVVIDTGTFGEYPETVVRKVRWDGNGPQDLAQALRDLAASATLRQTLGDTALAHVAREHSWSRVASLYAAVIDNTYDDFRRRGRDEPRGLAARGTSLFNP